jgi:MFS family permease|tara:strand:+ start:334 stop:1665 length:1332 start_codon:yes stop_codon:yes gene_type:complete
MIMNDSTETSKTNIDAMGLKFGPILLMPDIERRHLFTLFFGAFFGIASMSFVNVIGPLMFSILDVPQDETGGLAGTLTAVQEIVVILVIGAFGALSDKTGRRLVYSMGFFLLGVGYFLYPLASNTTELIIFRVFVALGCAANTVMLPTVANDYVHESTRGKLIATTSILNGLGLVLIIGTFRKLPGNFGDMGFDNILSGQYTAWVATVMCLIVSCVLFFNLKKGSPAQVSKKEPYLATLKVAFQAARNPRVALAYAAGVVSRGDLSVVSTFFSLWLFNEATTQGLSQGDAFKMATGFYVTVQAFAIPGAVLINFFIDKVDRVAALAIAMFIAAVGYLYLGFIENPLTSQMYFGAALLGLGEIFANISAISLIGSVAPVKGRGAVIGGFSFFGAVGILTVAIIGGYLFDNVSPTAPFTMVGFANICLLTIALLLLFFERKKQQL